MPTEKSRYMKDGKGPFFSFNEVMENIGKLPKKDLAKTLALAGNWDHRILGKINQLKIGFALYGPADIENLLELIDYALEIDEQVKYDRCSPYCQLVHIAEYCVKRFHEHGDMAATKKLADRVIDVAECSAEMLDDAVYWEMGIDELRQWRDELT